MRNVLICGATGFIGRNLVEAMATYPEFRITAQYHNRPPFDCPGVNWVQADLTRVEDADRVAKDADVIVQAAAVTSGVADIVSQPHIHITDNAVMNSLLFRAAHDHGVSHFILFSCSILYMSNEAARSEDDFTGEVHTPYHGGAWNKVYFEKMAEFFAAQGSTRYTVLRHSNMYGPYDKYDPDHSHMFGATVNKIMNAENGNITVWGDGTESRDLLYVSDLTDAVLAALTRQRDAFGLFNIGSGEAVQVRDVVKKIIVASGRELSIAYDTAKPTVPTNIHLNCKRAAAALDWSPKVSLDEGIALTLEWYRDNIMNT